MFGELLVQRLGTEDLLDGSHHQAGASDVELAELVRVSDGFTRPTSSTQQVAQATFEQTLASGEAGPPLPSTVKSLRLGEVSQFA